MDRDPGNRSSTKSLRALLDMHKGTVERETDFCTSENLANALLTLSEELESFDLLASTLDLNDSPSMESVKYTLIRLINATWGLAHKHRALIKVNDQASDLQHKTANDNSSLINHVKRLKDESEKKQHLLDESQEKERRLKVKCEVLSRELKREKDEVAKLRKQLQSKDIQHTHEVKRLQQNSYKLRDQLQKSVGTYVPRDKAFQNVQTEHERQLGMYKQTIHRLEENNRQLLLDNNDLRDELSLHSSAINLQAEASGIWNDAGI